MVLVVLKVACCLKLRLQQVQWRNMYVDIIVLILDGGKFCEHKFLRITNKHARKKFRNF